MLYELGSLARRPGAGADPVGALSLFDSAAAIRSSVGAVTRWTLTGSSSRSRICCSSRNGSPGWLDRKDLPPEQAALAAPAVAERGRARALLDLMRERKAALAPGADLVREGRDQVEWVQRAGSSALVYLVGRDTLTLWIIPASGQIAVRRLPVGRAEVAEAVQSYRVTIGVERGCDQDGCAGEQDLLGAEPSGVAVAR